MFEVTIRIGRNIKAKVLTRKVALYLGIVSSVLTVITFIVMFI